MSSDLRVVALDSLRRHEEVDPLRVSRLVSRIETEGIQVNPMVCVESAENLVVLDGATRTEALREMGLEHAVVQVVSPETVDLSVWHHVIRECGPEAVLEAVGSADGLKITEEASAPLIRFPEGETVSVATDSLSPNTALAGLVTSYIGKWPVTRIAEPDPSEAGSRFPDWSALVEMPSLGLEEVMTTAIGGDLLPAGVTRFLIPGRALRLNFPISVLTADLDLEAKQEVLDDLVEERSVAGRVRHYEEPVVILDD